MVVSKLKDIMRAFFSQSQVARLARMLMDAEFGSEFSIDGSAVFLWPQTELIASKNKGLNAQSHFEAEARIAVEAPGVAPFVAGKRVVVCRIAGVDGIRPDYIAVVPDETLLAFYDLRRIIGGPQNDGSTWPPRGSGRDSFLAVIRGMILGQSASSIAKTTGADRGTLRRWETRIATDIGAASTDGARAILLSALSAHLAAFADQDARRGWAELREYRRIFLPSGAEILFLPNPDKESSEAIPVFAMGPTNGQPVVALHAMILPDLGIREEALFERHGIRVYFPLRHGALSPRSASLSPLEHIAQARHGISAVITHLRGTPVHLAAMVTSSRIALEYACDHSDKITGLSFMAACKFEGRPSSGARGIAAELIALLINRAMSWDALARFMFDEVFGPKTFASYIRKHFAETGPDLKVIETELARWPDTPRMRYALANSLHSIRHDFIHQADLRWELAQSLNIPMTFYHGSEDRIHPPELIRTLVAEIEGAKLKLISGGGQLLYYEHFTKIIDDIAHRISNPEIDGYTEG